MDIGMNLGSYNKILTIQNHTRENETVARVTLVVFRLLLGQWVAQMCDSGSLGIEETDKQGGVDMGIISGHSHLMLPIYNHARKNAAAYGVFWVVFGLFWRPQGPLCDSRFLEMFEIR